MMALLGSTALWLAAMLAAASLGACTATIIKPHPRWLAGARIGMLVSAPCLAIAMLALATACLASDFRLAYVAGHTERALSSFLRIAASWAGQEGSLLLWATLIAGVGATVAANRRHMVGRAEPVTTGILAGLNLFFVSLILLRANPFTLLAAAPSDGRGLHPELQHWAMIAHPPIVFLGYSALAAPMAITAGALWAGRSDNGWVLQIRRWAIFGWMCLGAGIILGGWWAYVELGWGGYWVWDAVENASLIPWLAGTALIHSIIVHQHRGVLKAMTAALGLGTFILCLFGAFITRSGAVSSVHAFARSGIGAAFGVLVLALFAGAAWLLVRRRRALRASVPIESVAGREAITLMGDLLLIAMALVTLGGTSFPLLSALWSHDALKLNRSLYDHTVAPLGLAVAALMALSPLLAYGSAAGAILGRRAWVPATIAVVGAAGAFASGFHHPVTLICTAISLFACVAMVADWAMSVRTQSRRTGFGLLETAARIVDNNHRRYGGQIAHLGFLILILGIVGSSLFSQSATATLHAGESITVGPHTLRFDGVGQVQGANYTSAQASLILVSPRGSRSLFPEQRLYDKSSQPIPHIAVWTNWRDDLYVALLDWSRGGSVATIQARLNPLTIWIWIGGGVMVGASIFCLLPRLIPPPRDIPIPEARAERAAQPSTNRASQP